MVPAADERWFEKYKEASSLGFLEFLDGNKEERLREQEKFYAGLIDCPVFTYPFIDEGLIQKHRQLLTLLLEEILQKEQQTLVKESYADRIHSEILQLDILLATKNKNDKLFCTLSKKLYGAPKKSVYFSVVRDARERTEELLKSSLPENIRSLAEGLLEELPFIPKQFPYIKPPEEKNFLKLQKKTRERFNELLLLVDANDDRWYTAKEIQTVFQKALSLLGFLEWQVVITKTSKAAINVHNEEKTIFIPESREMNARTLREILVHEIGCHVTRHMNGARSGLLLLSLGLAHYERAEEGFATMAQQLISPSFKEYSGFERHLAIGLALGIDGTKRNFREVYSVLQKHYALLEYQQNLAASEIDLLQKSRTQAWQAATRVFRGTTAGTKGACFTKDIIYREGNINLWRSLSHKPGAIDDLFFGKIDPILPKHRQVLFWLRNKG